MGLATILKAYTIPVSLTLALLGSGLAQAAPRGGGGGMRGGGGGMGGMRGGGMGGMPRMGGGGMPRMGGGMGGMPRMGGGGMPRMGGGMGGMPRMGGGMSTMPRAGGAMSGMNRGFAGGAPGMNRGMPGGAGGMNRGFAGGAPGMNRGMPGGAGGMNRGFAGGAPGMNRGMPGGAGGMNRGFAGNSGLNRGNFGGGNFAGRNPGAISGGFGAGNRPMLNSGGRPDFSRYAMNSRPGLSGPNRGPGAGPGGIGGPGRGPGVGGVGGPGGRGPIAGGPNAGGPGRGTGMGPGGPGRGPGAGGPGRGPIAGGPGGPGRGPGMGPGGPGRGPGMGPGGPGRGPIAGGPGGPGRGGPGNWGYNRGPGGGGWGYNRGYGSWARGGWGGGWGRGGWGPGWGGGWGRGGWGPGWGGGWGWGGGGWGWGGGFWPGFGMGLGMGWGLGGLGMGWGWGWPGFGLGMGWGGWGLGGLGMGWGGWGLSPWIYGSSLYDWGYSSFYNPYVSTVVVEQPIIYDYSQPINTQAAVSVTPSDTTVSYFDQARDAFKTGNYTQALDFANLAIRDTPNDAALHEFRALSLYALGRYNEAATTLYSVLAVGPGWDWATLSSLYANPADYTTQLRSLEGYIGQNPESAPARFVLAYHYLTQGHTDAAAKQLRQVVALQPKDTLSAQLLKQIEPASNTNPATSSTTPSVPPLPGSALQPTTVNQPSNAAPVPAVSGKEGRLEGTWVAKPDSDTTITLTFPGPNRFSWTVAHEGKDQQKLEGSMTFGSKILTLAQNQGPALVGNVTWLDETHFTFKVPGAAPDDPGLSFSKNP